MISISNLNFSYGSSQVIKNITSNINEGEVVGVLGPNGAGKSTLIKLLSGLLKPTSGQVLLNNFSINKISHKDRAKKIAVVSQENNIPFAFKSIEVVLMGRTPHLPAIGFESARDLDVAKNAMTKTDSHQFASRNIRELSGGERQRVILARALAQESKILLLDEPTTFLDIRHQIEFYKLLRDENHERGLTIVSAMHDLNIASTFCDRLILLKNGQVLADGRPSEIITEEIIRKLFDMNFNTSLYSKILGC